MQKKCTECEKYETCTELCTAAERFVSQDYVSRRQFPDAALYPEGSERFWKGYVTLDWMYANYGFGDEGSCATLHKTIDLDVDLSILSTREQECVEMYYYEGVRTPQIAERLGIGVNTITKYLTTARRKLIKFYRK